MKGYESILQIAGYKEDSSMEDVLEPDKGELSILAAELLMAKLEVEQMNNAGSAVQQRQNAATIHHYQTNNSESALQVPSIKVTQHDHPPEEVL